MERLAFLCPVSLEPAFPLATSQMEFSEKIGAATIRYKLIAERKGMRCMRQLLFATKKDNLVEKFTIQVYYKVS